MLCWRSGFIGVMTWLCFLLLSAGCSPCPQSTPPQTLPQETIPHDPQLEGRWYWIESQESGAPTPLLIQDAEQGWPSINFTLKPHADSYGMEYDGYTGCNFMFGSYHAVSDPVEQRSYEPRQTIVILGVGRTLIECDDSLEEQEMLLVRVLSDLPRYSIEGERLTLTGRSGDVLTFSRLSPER